MKIFGGSELRWSQGMTKCISRSRSSSDWWGGGNPLLWPIGGGGAPIRDETAANEAAGLPGRSMRRPPMTLTYCNHRGPVCGHKGDTALCDHSHIDTKPSTVPLCSQIGHPPLSTVVMVVVGTWNPS